MAIPSKFGIPRNRTDNNDRGPRLAHVDINLLHVGSDVDASVKAQHHTLGTNRNQAARGNHNHDGNTSKKIGAGMGITLTGSRGGNAAVASIIAALKQVMDLTDNTTA